MKWVIFVNNMVQGDTIREKNYSHKKYKKCKNMIKVTKIIAIKNIKNTKTTLLNLMIFILKRKMFLKNMINKGQVKVNVLTMANLDILVKIAKKNLAS